MAAVDFGAWAAPNLEIKLGDRTYEVRPPSVEDAKLILALAVRGEVKLGMVKAKVPTEVEALIKTIPKDAHPALGDAFERMRRDGHPAATIDRVAYYAIFFWARGKAYADSLAAILWTPRATEAADASPKG
ncbi:hypothetical protein Q9S78_12055 [Microbacterium sp. KSW-18]|uniref:DUF7426 domain-containing protein n=1 Tax=Microbacterium aquilitoris TaxID=3067307 RepID=A0ABU3GL20_9MICO|nr:hypothetical protein [Microbacterium sp. KSW-18]MDT3331402.1 hypothetical protein [Microbacterium sp. KSW-18]